MFSCCGKKTKGEDPAGDRRSTSTATTTVQGTSDGTKKSKSSRASKRSAQSTRLDTKGATAIAKVEEKKTKKKPAKESSSDIVMYSELETTDPDTPDNTPEDTPEDTPEEEDSFLKTLPSWLLAEWADEDILRTVDADIAEDQAGKANEGKPKGKGKRKRKKKGLDKTANMDELLTKTIVFGTVADFDEYLNRTKIGEGGFGEVVLARDNKRMEDVAVKKIKAGKFKEADFKKEVQILQHLQGGPNIITLIDVVKAADGSRQLVFSYLKGCSANDLMKLEERTIRAYFFGTLRAVHFAHSMGVFHRDLKFDNVLFNPHNNELRLIDWGLADFYRPPPARQTMFGGTRTYMAPELFLRFLFYTHAVDMWALGCMLGRHLTGRRPMFRPKRSKEANPGWRVQSKLAMAAIAQDLGRAGLKDYTDQFNSAQLEDGEMPMRNWKRFEHMRAPQEASDWAAKYPDADPDGIDLLSKLLVWNHAERLTSREAMLHPYFNPVRGDHPFSSAYSYEEYPDEDDLGVAGDKGWMLETMELGGMERPVFIAQRNPGDVDERIAMTTV